MTAPDKYDEAIDYLTEHPDEISPAWGEGTSYRDDPAPEPGSALFNIIMLGGCASCLTQIAAGAPTSSDHPMIAKIRADVRIPKHPDLVTVDDLPALAELQREIDAARILERSS